EVGLTPMPKDIGYRGGSVLGAVAGRREGELGPAGNPHLLEDLVEVDLHRPFADSEFGRDLAVAHAAEDKARDRALALAQGAEAAGGGAVLRRQAELHRPLQHLMVDPAPPLHDRFEAGEQVLRSARLDDQAVEADLQRLIDAPVGDSPGEQDYGPFVAAFAQSPEHFESAPLRHVDVEQEQVRPGRGQSVQHGGAVIDLAYNLVDALRQKKLD